MPEIDLAWEALADPTRRSILRLLADNGELAAGAIAAEVNTVGRTAVSAQLRVLRTAGLIEERRAGRHRMYAIRPGATDEVVAFLGSLYSGSLQDLKRRVARGNRRAEADGSAPPR